ncbi:MAG: right-handed parallel beta-helix repeat-containing protein [Myxococcota bacterium]|nr:right-handed parallel beta-helix repeat-containing protein [Myxococcota bacterium]
MSNFLRAAFGVLTLFAAGCVEPDPSDSDQSRQAEPDLGEASQALNAPFKIYMSPGGYTSCNGVPSCGLVANAGVGKLALVAQILADQGFGGAGWATTHDANVEVHIAPGTYYHDSISWELTSPDYAITFMPRDNGSTKPVFNGCLTSTQLTCDLDTFFSMRKDGPTNLHIKNIRIERYRQAINFRGGSPSNSNNSIYGCYFYRIGSLHVSGQPNGYGVVSLNSSDRNSIKNSYFKNFENAGGNTALHALYISNNSDGNLISGNTFHTGNGIAVKLRNDCWWNTIEYNTFTKVGPASSSNAGYSDVPQPAEQVSCQSVFRYNVLDGNYNCGHLPAFYLGSGLPDTTCVGNTPPFRRLSTTGNTNDGSHCNGQ